MQDNGIVRGSKEASKPLIVKKTTVYVHTDIKEVEIADDISGEKNTIYEYHEVAYPKDEYIQLMAEQNQNLMEQINETQDALNYLIENS